MNSGLLREMLELVGSVFHLEPQSVLVTQEKPTLGSLALNINHTVPERPAWECALPNITAFGTLSLILTFDLFF